MGVFYADDDSKVGEKGKQRTERKKLSYIKLTALSSFSNVRPTIVCEYLIQQMSNLQRRAKNIGQIPLINMTDDKTELSFNDPRSPSANVSR